ncbi:MAG: cytochrome c oxidase-assembly factor cox23 [Lasallia pustulata]|uniref:Cytochrome c oxidase-assembly factor COX23, mitochondrial n=1 Tax=Lasallia pustulata TaxID=136370 RepID=A0A1W5D211_9LECA|nr:MAG: cytochrome c oxidase-assembly factor cox23 [Lasallia pustulata]SLM36919.1 cytochrome c oxidase-assembly factor cox23 protein [Lasallia pustulata]
MVEAGEDQSPWAKAESGFTTKRNSEYFDPCQEAAARSMKCLHRNGGDRDLCTDYFQAYRDCKKQWMTERKESKRREGKSTL